MADKELEETCRQKFIHYGTEHLIQRIEKAPDFGYDDEEIELSRRLRAEGKTWKWDNTCLFKPKIIVEVLNETVC